MRLFTEGLKFYKEGIEQSEIGIECKNTPAREAGITESKWTLKELLKFR